MDLTNLAGMTQQQNVSTTEIKTSRLEDGGQ